MISDFKRASEAVTRSRMDLPSTQLMGTQSRTGRGDLGIPWFTTTVHVSPDHGAKAARTSATTTRRALPGYKSEIHC